MQKPATFQSTTTGKHFSFTQLETFLKCGYRYYRRYERGEKIAPGVGLIRGGALSKAMEADLRTKIATGQLLEREEVAAFALDHVTAEMAHRDSVVLDDFEQGMGFARVRGQTQDLAVRAACCHHDDVAPTLEPEYVEQPMTIQLPGVTRSIVLVADVIEADGTIRDGKSVTKTPHEDQAATTAQLPLYKWGYEQLTGRKSPTQVLDVIVTSKAAAPRWPARHFEQRVESTPDDVARVSLRMQAAINSIERGIFPPAPESVWWCSKSWCGYHATCPYVRGGAVVTVPGINDQDVEDLRP